MQDGGLTVAGAIAASAGAREAAMRFGIAELPGGPALPYAERGDPDGLPVLLLHGYTDSWRSFEPVLPHVSQRIRAVAVSQRGHGDAARPAEGYGLGDFSEDLEGFMNALGIRRAVVVGHSMGSAVAQRFALDHPDRVSGLVLAGSFATARGNPGVEELWRETVAELLDPVNPAFVRAFQAATLAAPVPAELLETAIAESLKVPARIWRLALAGLLDADHSDELWRIGCPALVLWGDRDAFFPRTDQDALLAAMPRAQLLTYAGCGHGLHWEQPQRFASNVSAFVEAVAARS